MTTLSSRSKKRRRGAIAVLAALLLIFMVGMVAFAVDLGYLALSKTQLQAAADSAALAAAATTNQPQTTMVAVAQQVASANSVAGRAVQLSSGDIHYGNWNTTTRAFTSAGTAGNAVQVTVRTGSGYGGATPLFFGKVFNVASLNQSATAVATVNPRDIAFLIDLSGSMNDDTEPLKTASIDSTSPGSGTTILNQVYSDFGYPVTYPNEPSQFIGQPLGITQQSSETNTLSKLTASGAPLTKTTIPSQYRVLTSDSSSTKTKKAYSWIMDVQLGQQLMPAATPAPNSTNSASYNYWKTYIDYYWSTLGYRMYVEYMMYHGGRDGQPGGMYTPLSQFSSYCPYHSESTVGGTFSFPPREMPTHSARRALIAALQVVKTCNQGITDPNQCDWVSIITFDQLSAGAVIKLPLTSNYASAMQACTTLQAVSEDDGASTATEVGLIAAANHIKPASQGGSGRTSTNKIVVLLTDGMPNLYSSSNSTISSYEQANPSSNFYGGSSNYPQDASLMQTAMMQGNNWFLYPVGIGAACNYDFMDRMARMGATADKSGQSPRGPTTPDDYEAVLTQIFQNILTNPKLHIVQ
jgi:hypothetical protein